ncbi:hypothetical protein [Nocardioides sp.]|uniref:hypothetical protein n=1 Tax=Nocardioides sp. TaxID=35761 RepID=UPI003D0CF945
MRSTVTSICAALGVATALASATVALTAGSAAAALLPSTAVPASAAGDTVDCSVTAQPLTVTGTQVSGEVSLTCSAGADIHRAKSAPSLYEVLPGGTLRELVAPGGFGLTSSTAPILSSGSGVLLDCGRGSGLSGTHTYLLRARVTVKHTTTHSSTPYVAKVARKQVVTCP